MYEKSSGAVIKKGSGANIKTEVKINENIQAPVKKGDKLGVAEFYLDDNLISSVNLVASKSIDKMTAINMYKYITNLWFRLFRV